MMNCRVLICPTPDALASHRPYRAFVGLRRGWKALLMLCLCAAMGMALDAQTAKVVRVGYFFDPGADYQSNVAVDGNGNIYVSVYDTNNNVSVIRMIPRGCGSVQCESTVTAFTRPVEVAADQSGNVFSGEYIPSPRSMAVQKMPAGCTSASCVVTLATLPNVGPLAVDPNGNVYILDGTNNKVVELPAGCGSSACTLTLGGGFSNLAGIAADKNGNVYVTEAGTSASFGFVQEIPAGCMSASCVVTLGGNYYNNPEGIAVDGNGNVYVTDNVPDQPGETDRINEMPAGCVTADCVSLIWVNGQGRVALAVDMSGKYLISPEQDGGTPAVAEFMTKPEPKSVPIGSSLMMTVAMSGPGPNFQGTATVQTQGAANQDFTIQYQGSGAYDGQNYFQDVFITPKHPGLRQGAVTLVNPNNTRLGSVAISGIGVGPQIVFSSNPDLTILGGGFNGPAGVSVDGTGNVFVADTRDSAVKMIPSGCTGASCVVTRGGGFHDPAGVAVDGAGNTLVADTTNNAVKLIPVGCTTASCVVTLGGGFHEPTGVAPDGFGDVLVADAGSNTVKKIPAGCMSSACVSTLGGGFNMPMGVAIDGNSTVYVADAGNHAVKAIPMGCAAGSCVATLGGGFDMPTGVAVDASGNVFVADSGNNAAAVIPVGCVSSSCVATLGSGFNAPKGAALDASGNLFIADANNAVKELAFGVPPSLTFAATKPGQTSSDSPQTVVVANDGNAPLMLSSLSAPSNFPLDGETTCTSSTTLNIDELCALAIDFTPGTIGSYSANLVLTDNSLNANPHATQNIGLSGVGAASQQAAAPVFSPAVGKYAGSVTVALTDSTPNAVIHYTLNGTVPTAWSPVYTGPLMVTSSTEIQAIAISAGYPQSAVAGGEYHIVSQTPTPVISPASGTYALGQSITISDSDATATIRYTTDGTVPNSHSMLYTGPITLTGSETVQSIAVSTDEAQSGVAAVSYTVR